MKNRCKYVSTARLIALLMSALLLLSMLPLAGAIAAQSSQTTANKGSLTVKLTQDTYDNLPSDPQVKVKLYMIGDAAPDTTAGWRMKDAFKGYKVIEAKDSGELGAVAVQMAADVVKNNYAGTEQELVGGSSVFGNLDYGIYLGVLTGGPEGLEVEPFIVTVPSRNPKDPSDLRSNYDVTLKDKCVTEATVVKDWKDENDQDGIRPNALVVKLLADGKDTKKSVTLNTGNSWKDTLSGLARYSKGKAIVYSWSEENLPAGYELSGSATSGVITTLTNKHTPEETEATVKKVWEDNNNSDNARPAFIEVTLSNGTKVKLSDENSWTSTVSHLPKYENGKEIKYTWTEAFVDGYTSTQVTNGTITTLTNVRVPTATPTVTVPTDNPTPPPTTQVDGTKIWVDDSNAHKTRPDGITVTLYADGVPVNATPTWSNQGTDKWTFSFKGLPALNDNGSTINYTVKETAVEGYETTVNGTTITNKLIPKEPKEFKELSGVKTWVKAQNGVTKMPTHITVYLLRNGEVIETRTVTAANNWNYSFGKQPLDDGYGNKYEYTVREDGVPGFFCRVDGLNLINSVLQNPPTGRRYTPTGNVPNRKTGTKKPPFERMNAKEFNDNIDILDYNTPLWGQLLGTGDQTPLYPYIFGGVGLIAVIALLVFGKKRGKKREN